ncbi:MAG TPA: methylenetetrahydrofolate reductase [NAD(P)H] [Candidatus Dormibacteraeota bacterium]|jgi:methylenetetrahydrofolate reductase (NADPH)|nr:methylenetetrahydrofolate reductase [NAD(P)H] [Candidatus Dormibacteraeota bacterium]
MRIDEQLAGDGPVFSFEFFPPETPEGEERLFQTIAQLRELSPTFVSVTCRNHSRARTLAVVTRIRNEMGIEPMAHYTCAGATRAELHDTLRGLREAGISNVLALRGDPPRGSDRFEVHPGGFAHASDLAAMIRDEYDFCIGGACYPEGHLESASLDADMADTVAKVNSGMSFLITQMFFDNTHYFDFVARARAAGVTVPIIPGIMPITTLGRLSRSDGTLFGAQVPAPLLTELLRRVDEPEAIAALGTAYATLQSAELLAGGAPGVHFYTLNRSPSTRAILSALLASRPWERAR